ncbi:alpha/beta hydrolase family protein [Oryzifoliimicrobium ureilyticus]|uniref:alpha/beta hydrolase family protein n=1 Tax=Oryzifoliimicrobium ureilyticus TaxID=3113724 RepID=UPI003076766A
MSVGFRQGVSEDPARLAWDASRPRPLAWTAWYTAAEDAVPTRSSLKSLFRREAVAVEAPLAASTRSFPLVLLSHGTGATALALEWLAHRLAQQGYVVLGVDHHGHTGSETYRAEGFLCMWERARDLSALLSDLSWRAALGGNIDEDAHLVGFSAGAYTAMLMVGARIAYSQFEPDNPVKSPIRGPREFPDLADRLPALFDNPVFREAWERRRDDHSDNRIKSAFAIAPGRSVLGFDRNSLHTIQRPVFLVAADADRQAPAECWRFLHDNVGGPTESPKTTKPELDIVHGGVDHYVFLPEAALPGFASEPELFADPPGIQRREVHDHVAECAIRFFARQPERIGTTGDV